MSGKDCGGSPGRRPIGVPAASPPPVLRALLVLLSLPVLLGAACSPLYVLRAGYHEAKILAGREPITRLVRDPTLDPEVREKLRLALEARRFAEEELGLDAGDAYRTYSEVESDTLALVLSAAHRDRLESVTWWFPVVGRVPYRAYFDREDALEEEAELREEGYDTYLRPTAAFSTLGWFADPLLSTVVRRHETSLVETVIHELAHNTVYLAGATRFNESFASFVGGAGAAAFFCREGGDGSAGERETPGHPPAPDSAAGPGEDLCRMARDRWADDRRFSRFLDGVVEELAALYRREDISREEVLRRREAVFRESKVRFVEEVRPALRVSRYAFFTDIPLNNAVLLARMRYYHRLYDFDALLRRSGGNVGDAVRRVAERLREVDDPFGVLEPDAGGS